jgi:two-component system invasion response regulator UvrY
LLATPLPIVDVAVVTSSPLMLGGLTHVFGGLKSVRVTHQANTITELPPSAAAVVIVTDLYGVTVDEDDYWSLAPQGAPIVALCRPDNPPNLLTAVRGGVHALIGRDSETIELVLAVRIARRRGLHVAPELFGALTNAARPLVEPSPNNLSQREIEALRYLAGGLTHRQISRRMGLTETTVSTYVKRIRHKLHAGNKAELTRFAIELGYVDPLDRQHL